MATDYATANAIKEEYKDLYGPRHQAFKDLRRFWQGDYWKIAQQAKTARSSRRARMYREGARRSSADGSGLRGVLRPLMAHFVATWSG